MKHVTICDGSIENFKSFHKKTKLIFDTESKKLGFNLITGINLVEPRLGANGVGKSSLWDAVCYCLFGTGIKTSRASELLSIDKKRLAIELNICVDGEFHLINRSYPPNKIYIDGVESEQQDIDNLIDITKQQFLNSVIFGQAVPLFIDLSVPARGDLLDELLQLELWMEASDKASAIANVRNLDLSKVKLSISKIEGQISSLKEIDLDEEENNWNTKHESEISELLNEFEEQEIKFNKKSKELSKLKELKYPDINNIDFDIGVLEKATTKNNGDIAVFNANMLNLKDEITFYTENTDCKLCGQQISPEFAKGIVDKNKKLLNDMEFEVKELQHKIKANREEIQNLKLKREDIITKYNAKNGIFIELKTQVLALENSLNRIEKDLNKKSEETNPYTIQKDKNKERVSALTKELFTVSKEKRNIEKVIETAEFWKQEFKQVRLYCLKKVLRELEIETMNAANELGLVGWDIHYTTETETKSGTTKFGVQILIKSVLNNINFSSLSGGESQRVRLCVALGLASLIERWAGVKFNLQVWDEPSAWLSQEGIEDLLQCLNNLCETRQKSLYICDHRALIYSGFTDIITLQKTERGTEILQ